MTTTSFSPSPAIAVEKSYSYDGFSLSKDLASQAKVIGWKVQRIVLYDNSNYDYDERNFCKSKTVAMVYFNPSHPSSLIDEVPFAACVDSLNEGTIIAAPTRQHDKYGHLTWRRWRSCTTYPPTALTCCRCRTRNPCERRFADSFVKTVHGSLNEGVIIIDG